MTPPTTPSPSRSAIVLWVALLCLLWSSTWVAIKIGLRDVPPFTSAATRFAIAAAVMAIVAPWLGRRERGVAPPAWLWMTVGITNFALSYGLVYFGSTVLDSGIASVLWAVFPLLMSVCGHFFLPGERLRPRHGVGMVLGFGGVALLFANDLPKFGPDAIPVALLYLCSPLSCCIGTTLLKRHGGHTSSVLLNRNAMAVGAILLGAFAWAAEGDVHFEWTGPAIVSMLYLALLGTCLTFGVYFWLLRHAPATKLSMIAYVTPALTLYFGWLILGEPLQADTLIGSGAIVLGVAVAVSGRR